MFHIKELVVGCDKNNKQINYQLSIVEYVKQNNRLPDWLKSISNINYYLKPLKIDGVLRKKGYGIWEVNWSNWMGFVQKRTSSKSDKELVNRNKGYIPLVRGHGFQFYLNIPTRIDWSRREVILKNMNVSYEPLGNLQFRLRIYGHKVWFTEKGIIVYFPSGRSFYGDSAKSCYNKALYEFERVIRRISSLSGLDYSIKGKLQFTLDKQHYADIEHELAVKYNNDKEKLKVIGEDGKVWLLIDFSNKNNELEYVHSKKAQVDRDDRINPHMNDIRNNIVPLPSEAYKMILGLIEHDKMYAENQASHLKAIQELGRAVHKLTDEVSLFKKAQLNMYQKKISDF